MSSKKPDNEFRRKQIKQGEDVSGEQMAFLMLDTSWRVAVPIVSLSLAGRYIDQHTNHKILFSLSGFFVSLAIVILLVYRQLCIVFPDQFGKYKKKDN